MGQEPQPPMGSSFLRSLLKPRSRAPSPDQGAPVADANVLQALTQGVRQLQELQAQALSKATSGQATEVVKPGTTALAQLPVCEGQAEAALAFQDWVEVSASAMGDISERSGAWWASVIKLVEDTYAGWLS